jgi:hypothetical protein
VAITDTSTLKPKTRIVAARPLPGVPEGTGGKLGRSVGLSLTRYRVAFDNGVDLTSVTHTKVVKEDEWEDLQEQRADAAASAAAGEAAALVAAEEAPAEEKAASPADDRLAALLAKSKAAKEKKQAEG